MDVNALVDAHAYAASAYGDDHPTTKALLELIREACS